MATPEELQQYLKDMETARSTGAKRVRFQSHEVEYHTPQEIEAAINAVKRQLAEISPAPRIQNIQAVRGYR